ncbi:hypothetical protein RFI_33678 [Reticulomyxa filosa]|uniref:Uncharacterized protein n=1 Tax=Reticulomyxa filosa TaxID=46433 RepID=X6LQ15_RETFI|nr:hypothetical protein RFI_33678 [Reticulomyxa filosa]|eukprot:ETO03724.1 hypothetical protein RFI_33678 [Reticulomyxa filosa]
MILLTWVLYDQYIQQAMQISAMWNHSIDLNLIYTILLNVNEEIAPTNKFLSAFEAWRMQPNNNNKYKEKKKEYIERRCCNHNINLFSIFLAEMNNLKKIHFQFATISTVQNGLPFVEKDKDKLNNKQ